MRLADVREVLKTCVCVLLTLKVGTHISYDKERWKGGDRRKNVVLCNDVIAKVTKISLPESMQAGVRQPATC